MFVINADDKPSKEAHWVSLFIDKNTDVYFDSFGNEYIPQDVLKKSKINQPLTSYLEYNLTILYCVDFIVSLL